MTDPTDPTTAATSKASPIDAAPPTEPVAPTEPSPPAEPRQRWRLTFARDPVPAEQVGRTVLDAWQESLAASGLPLAGLEDGGAGRARIAFAAPLPAAARGDAELAELWLLDRRPLWEVREALAPRLPAAHRWVGAEDIWLGAPALAGRVVAADWHIEIAGSGLNRDRLAEAARTLIAARTLPRTRVKGATEKRYDLRPLLADVVVDARATPATDPAAASGPLVIRLRTRIHPELGAGRPEEVVGALADSCGVALEIGSVARIRLILSGELPVRGRCS